MISRRICFLVLAEMKLTCRDCARFWTKLLMTESISAHGDVDADDSDGSTDFDGKNQATFLYSPDLINIDENLIVFP